MAFYYVNQNAQTNGDHEVHTPGCSHMPSRQYRRYLGDFESFDLAVKEAKRTYVQSIGCYYCSSPCYTT